MTVNARIGLIIDTVTVNDTWAQLPDDEQTEWALFFDGYIKNVSGPVSDGGSLAQIWALAHNYYKAYGPLWD
jgi:hypothetical protein